MALPKQEFVISAKDETKIAFDSIKGSLSNIESAGLTLNRTLGVLAPLLGAATFTTFLKGGIDTLDMLGDLSDRTGVAASTLSGFQLVAAQSDTSLDALGKGLNKLSLFMANNSEQAKKLGITAKDPAEAFIQFAAALERTNGPQERAAAANLVLGKSYAELLPALNQGADALRSQIEEGQKLANVTDKNVQQAQQFNDQLDKLKLGGSQLSVSLAGDLLPSFIDITGAMKTAADEAGILTALFVGLGGVTDLVFNGTKIKQAADGVSELEQEIKKLEARKKALDKGDSVLDFIYGKSENQSRLNKAKQELVAAQKVLADLKSPPKTEPVKPKEGIDLADLNKPTGKSQAQKDAESAAKSAQAFTDKLKEQSATLGLSKTALLEYDAAQLNLTRTQQASVQGSIAKIEAYERELAAVKELADFEKLLQESDNRELAALEEQSQLEQQLQATREADFQTFYENITRLNEDLNVQLLSSDKKRAQAQIDLENERAIERINSLGLETEEVQRLLELQAESYDLQTKKLVQQGTSDFDDLKRAVRGFGDDAARTFTEFTRSGKADFGGLVDSMLADLERLALQKKVLDPIFQGFESFLDGVDFSSIFSVFTANANGNVYSGAGISAYSNSIVSTPTLFPFAKGTGLMGEAGPEAILPLTRVGGKLGVQSTGGSALQSINVSIENKGTPSQVLSAQPVMTADGVVIKIMMDDLRSNGPITRGLSGTFGLQRGA